ncbi:hypothetical protein ACHAPJ_011328 [Fusarium lateritium]
MGYRVAAIDVGSHAESCLSLGAEAYFDASTADMVTSLKKLTPNEAGVRAVIVTAGSGRAYQSALEILAVFGTLVCVGIPPPDQAMSLHPLTVIDRGITVIGTLVGTRTETLEALEFVRRGSVKPKVTLTSFEDLDEVAHKPATAGKLVLKF